MRPPCVARSIAPPRQTGSAARVHSCRGWEGPSRRAGQGWSFTGPSGWAWAWQEAGLQDLRRARARVLGVGQGGLSVPSEQNRGMQDPGPLGAPYVVSYQRNGNPRCIATCS